MQMQTYKSCATKDTLPVKSPQASKDSGRTRKNHQLSTLCYSPDKEVEERSAPPPRGETEQDWDLPSEISRLVLLNALGWQCWHGVWGPLKVFWLPEAVCSTPMIMIMAAGVMMMLLVVLVVTTIRRRRRTLPLPLVLLRYCYYCFPANAATAAPAAAASIFHS